MVGRSNFHVRSLAIVIKYRFLFFSKNSNSKIIQQKKLVRKFDYNISNKINSIFFYYNNLLYHGNDKGISIDTLIKIINVNSTKNL